MIATTAILHLLQSFVAREGSEDGGGWEAVRNPSSSRRSKQDPTSEAVRQ
jgi:hypothetical protein